MDIIIKIDSGYKSENAIFLLVNFYTEVEINQSMKVLDWSSIFVISITL